MVKFAVWSRVFIFNFLSNRRDRKPDDRRRQPRKGSEEYSREPDSERERERKDDLDKVTALKLNLEVSIVQPWCVGALFYKSDNMILAFEWQ